MAYEKIGFNKGDVLTAAHMNHIEEGIGALDTGKLDTDALPAALKEALRAVSYEMFGAALNGVTDDTDAIIAAHEYANANGYRIEQHTGTAYLKTATADHCPVVRTDCDWSGMTFVITEAMAKNVILRAEPDEGIRTVSLSPEQIGQLAQGAISVPFLADYPNCICHFTTDIV